MALCGSPLERGVGVCPLGISYKHTPAITLIYRAPSQEGNLNYSDL